MCVRSLMDVKMLSTTEHIAGGQVKGGITLHTEDAGKTYTTKGANIKVSKANSTGPQRSKTATL